MVSLSYPRACQADFNPKPASSPKLAELVCLEIPNSLVGVPLTQWTNPKPKDTPFSLPELVGQKKVRTFDFPPTWSQQLSSSRT